MVLDSIVKNWCDEFYDSSRENEYGEYAKYVTIYPWLRGLRLHRIFLWFVFALLLTTEVSSLSDLDFETFLQIMEFIGICTLAFIPYGFKKYHLGDGTTAFFYALMVLSLMLICEQLPAQVQNGFAIAMIPVSFVLHYVLPISKAKFVRRMKKFHHKHQQMLDDAKDELDKASFDSWNNRMGYHIDETHYHDLCVEHETANIAPYQPTQGMLEVVNSCEVPLENFKEQVAPVSESDNNDY